MQATTALPVTTGPQKSIAALRGLRQRLRRLFLTDGLSSITVGLLLTFGISFLLDYSLHLPVGVRVVFLGGGLVAVFVFLRRKILGPMSQPVSDGDLAKLVEQANPELKQSLLTAIELTQPGNEGALFVSPELLGSVVKDVEENVASVSFDRIFDLRRLRMKAVGVVVALVALSGAGLLSPGFRELSGTWLRRNLLLSAQAWPKQTELRLVQPTQNPAVVAVGDSLDVTVEVTRGTPAAVSVESVLGEGRTVRVEPMAEIRERTYNKVFPNVSRPFRFSARAGDGETEWVEVDVKLRPRIDMQSIKLWCAYPAYTQLTNTPVDGPIRSGHLKVPEGTAVSYEMKTNVPVQSAYYLFWPREAGRTLDGDAWPGEGAVLLELDEQHTFSGEFQVETSGQYFFQFETQEGFRSRRPDRFRVDAIPDRKPVVKIVAPERMAEEVSPEAKVVIRVTAHDDYGIVEGKVVGFYYPEGSEDGQERTFILEQLPGSIAAPPTEGEEGKSSPDNTRDSGVRVEDSITLNVATLSVDGQEPPRPGSRFQFYAVATDSAGKDGESRVYELEIVAKSDLLRILTADLMVRRDQLAEILRRQRSVRLDLESFRKQVLLQEQLDGKQASKLVRFRQDQQRVSKALAREVRQMDRILAKMAANNVGERKWRNWVKNLRGDIDELASQKSPEIEREFSDLQEEAKSSPQPVTRVTAIANDQRKLERDLESLVMRLTEFGDVNALVEMLREVRRRQTEVREATRTRMGGSSTE